MSDKAVVGLKRELTLVEQSHLFLLYLLKPPFSLLKSPFLRPLANVFKSEMEPASKTMWIRRKNHQNPTITKKNRPILSVKQTDRQTEVLVRSVFSFSVRNAIGMVLG